MLIKASLFPNQITNFLLVLDDVTVAGVNPEMPTVIAVKSYFTATSGNFGNVTVEYRCHYSGAVLQFMQPEHICAVGTFKFGKFRTPRLRCYLLTAEHFIITLTALP